ncbi:hypothetical protein ACSLBF_16790 [Pseudoalteromonas sp. T1lg65]|uniref:hypothetical protein n=1 Tax=Pseudoalteromonas sp. T1lg65 TaxID=2077101 RepID=UPI003F7A87CD
MKKVLKALAENPILNFIAGLILCITSAFEIVDNITHIGSHHGVFLFGLLHILKTLPELNESIHLFDEASK